MGRLEPIIEYAHKIGKNTAELTVNDLVAFTKWWIKQPPRKDLMEATPEQRKVYEQDVAKVQKFFKEQNMSKQGAYQAAMKSRLGNKNELSVRNMSEVVMEEEAPAEEIVCSIELTKTDVEALLWVINEIFENYDLTGTTHDLSLKSVQEGLQGVELSEEE